MTEQEAEVFVARLARVWGALTIFEVHGGVPFFSALLSQDVQLDVSIVPVSQTSFCWQFCLDSPGETSSLSTFLYCNDVGGPAGYSLISCPKGRFLRNRQTEWLPRFRSGCWLSGCNIEISAHEKLEWVQGFGRQEIESWNLKF